MPPRFVMQTPGRRRGPVHPVEEPVAPQGGGAGATGLHNVRPGRRSGRSHLIGSKLTRRIRTAAPQGGGEGAAFCNWPSGRRRKGQVFPGISALFKVRRPQGGGEGRRVFPRLREEEKPQETVLLFRTVGRIQRHAPDQRPIDAEILKLAAGQRLQLAQGLTIYLVALQRVAQVVDCQPKAKAPTLVHSVCVMRESHSVSRFVVCVPWRSGLSQSALNCPLPLG